MNVKGNHPIAEILAKKLSGIETVPPTEQKQMVSRAVKAAVEYHEREKDQIVKDIVNLFTKQIRMLKSIKEKPC